VLSDKKVGSGKGCLLDWAGNCWLGLELVHVMCLRRFDVPMRVLIMCKLDMLSCVEWHEGRVGEGLLKECSKELLLAWGCTYNNVH
jgi:hypothetical protein